MRRLRATKHWLEAQLNKSRSAPKRKLQTH